jgi:hypothetical protein
MFSQGRGVYEHVVEVHQRGSVVQVSEHSIHQSLKSCRAIAQAHWKEYPLEVAIARTESGFWRIVLMH